MIDLSLESLKHTLAFLISRKVDLSSQVSTDPLIFHDGREAITFDVSGLRRGLHYISIRYRAEPKLMGPRLSRQERGSSETQDQVFIFEADGDQEIFGTVYIGPGTEHLTFYPSRLESKLTLEAAFVRPITEFARENIYGISFVQRKMFGLGWWLQKSLQDARERIRTFSQGGEAHGYPDWWGKYGACSGEDLERQSGDRKLIESGPLISVILPVYNPSLDLLKAAVNSVLMQSYPGWQLCICDDCSSSAELRDYLETLAAGDDRIDVTFRKENGHISRASNDALGLAKGSYVAFLDHDDLLTPDALYEFARAIVSDPALRLLYSDEDVVTESGEPVNGHFKPDWNPDLARAINYVCHLLVIDRALVELIGGLRPGFEGAQDFDLLLRASEHIDARQIHHIPRVLYHWRAAPGSTASTLANKPYAAEAGLRAITEWVQRSGLRAQAEASEIETAYRVRYQPPEQLPSVTIVVPTRDQLRVLKNCVRSVLEVTDYDNYEIVIVDNASQEEETREYLQAILVEPRIRVIEYDKPFNFSAINNWAVARSESDVVVLLNNDTEPLNRDWLTELVSQACRPEVGAVGAKLLYANDRIQHAGVILGLGGDRIAGHAFKGKHKNEVGSLARTRLVQEYCAVTGACLAVSRVKYLEVSGLDEENLAVAYNDVDFCLRLREAGYRNIWTPYAQLYHYESYSRGPDSLATAIERYQAEADYMRKRWGGELSRDPFYNPNLSRGLYNFDLAWPPYPGS